MNEGKKEGTKEGREGGKKKNLLFNLGLKIFGQKFHKNVH